jgi:predicted membrane protein
VLNEFTVFGGVRRRIDSQEFEGGEVSAIFGGVEIDLRGAATKKDEVVIELNAIFGGVELRVPDTWDVTVRGAGIFGGYEDKTMPRRDTASGKRPLLVITGSAVFGGVTVM